MLLVIPLPEIWCVYFVKIYPHIHIIIIIFIFLIHPQSVLRLLLRSSPFPNQSDNCWWFWSPMQESIALYPMFCISSKHFSLLSQSLLSTPSCWWWRLKYIGLVTGDRANEQEPSVSSDKFRGPSLPATNWSHLEANYLQIVICSQRSCGLTCDGGCDRLKMMMLQAKWKYLKPTRVAQRRKESIHPWGDSHSSFISKQQNVNDEDDDLQY